VQHGLKAMLVRVSGLPSFFKGNNFISANRMQLQYFLLLSYLQLWQVLFTALLLAQKRYKQP
jgi:hypothetical protein